MRIDVRSNINEVIADLGSKTPQMIRRATVSALNVGMRKAQTLTVRAASKEIGVAQKHIRGRMKRFNAKRSNLESTVRFNPRGLNPSRLGMSPQTALKYYEGQHVGQPFYMTMPNGSTQIVVRLPSSVNPSPPFTRTGERRKGRLPVRAIRIFIGREVIDRFNRVLATDGIKAFEGEFYRYLQANWGD